MKRICKDILLLSKLHHRSKIHHADLIRQELDHRKVMRNEQIRKIGGCLQALEQIDDLRLHRNVERGNRLVANHQLGLDRQGARDANSLTLTARELVRISLVIIITQAALLHQIQHVFLDLVARNDSVHLDRLGKDVSNRGSGRQRGIGILENDLHIGAEMAHLRIVILGDVLSVEDDLSAAGGMELEHRSSHRGLSATGLSNDAKRFSCLEGEGYVVNRNKLLENLSNKVLLDGKSLGEVSDLKQNVGIRRLTHVRQHTRLLFFLCLGSDGFVVVFDLISHCSAPPLRKGGKLRNEWGSPAPCRGTHPSISWCTLSNAP